MTPQEQPDSQAGDEQTETDELIELRKNVYSKVYYGLTMAEAEHYTDWIIQLVVDYSRQQTARVLDKLSKHHFIADNETTFSGRIELVFKSSIDAELAALRGGLEGK